MAHWFQPFSHSTGPPKPAHPGCLLGSVSGTLCHAGACSWMPWLRGIIKVDGLKASGFFEASDQCTVSRCHSLSTPRSTASRVAGVHPQMYKSHGKPATAANAGAVQQRQQAVCATAQVSVAVRELSKAYGATTALDSVSFDICKDHITALLGANLPGLHDDKSEGREWLHGWRCLVCACPRGAVCVFPGVVHACRCSTPAQASWITDSVL